MEEKKQALPELTQKVTITIPNTLLEHVQERAREDNRTLSNYIVHVLKQDQIYG